MQHLDLGVLPVLGDFSCIQRHVLKIVLRAATTHCPPSMRESLDVDVVWSGVFPLFIVWRVVDISSAVGSVVVVGGWAANCSGTGMGPSGGLPIRSSLLLAHSSSISLGRREREWRREERYGPTRTVLQDSLLFVRPESLYSTECKRVNRNNTMCHNKQS